MAVPQTQPSVPKTPSPVFFDPTSKIDPVISRPGPSEIRAGRKAGHPPARTPSTVTMMPLTSDCIARAIPRGGGPAQGRSPTGVS